MSASGTNGATGDPDGDGIVNLLEFELGTVPTGPNGPAYRFHREKMGQLHVVIQDSKNCPNGTKAHNSQQNISQRIPFVEILDTNLPPMELRFMVSVTGRVERQNSGFDAVSVNGVRAFTGSNEGMGCEMAGKSNSIVVPVQVPPGELVLNYDTGDGLFHVGAFAKVTGIELTQAETNVPRVDVVESEVYGCAGCSNGCSVTLHLTNSYPAGSAAYWYGGPSNALLGTGTSVTIDYSAWPAKSYRIAAVATGNVAYADACVLHVLKVDITPEDRTGCPRCLPSLVYSLTNSFAPNGVTWSIIPPNLSGGATITPNGSQATVDTGTIGTNYTIRATSVDSSNCYDDATLTIYAPGSIVQANNYYDDTTIPTESHKAIRHHFSPSPPTEDAANHFCFVQRLTGSCRRGNGTYFTVTMYGNIVPFNFTNWVIDSVDDNAAYWSQSPHYNHDAAGGNVYFVEDDPGPAKAIWTGSVFSVDFTIGIYCTNEVPISGCAAQPTTGTPFDTAAWDYKVSVTTNGTFTYP